MVQFYLLSIIANVVGGLALSAGYIEEKVPALAGIKKFFNSRPTLRTYIGAITAVVGVLKLLSATGGDVPFFGDLVPALTGLVVGTALLVDRYKESATMVEEHQTGIIATIDRVILKRRNAIGTIAVFVGLVHFLLPRLLLL